MLAPLGIWVLTLGYPYSLGLFLLLLIGLLLEWFLLIGNAKRAWWQKGLWSLGGTLYIIGGVWGFYQFYAQSALKALILLFVIWATDIGAYLIGNLWGGPKLWPSVSPKKTWSGSIGGTGAAMGVILIAASFDASFRSLSFIILYIMLSIAGQLGDLLESAVKRFFQVKDTGELLPGHGGLLDRFDSTLAVGFVLLLFKVFLRLI
jgi:phosphatidate cytidylyltransferase